MGCDIHFVIERRLPERTDWVGVLSTDVLTMNQRPKAANRDYHFFANVAGVRGTPDRELGGQYAKFIPADMSLLSSQQMIMRGTDGHSHSYMSAAEFIQIWANCNPSAYEQISELRRFGEILGIYEDEGSEYRVVFWFDN